MKKYDFQLATVVGKENPYIGEYVAVLTEDDDGFCVCSLGTAKKYEFDRDIVVHKNDLSFWVKVDKVDTNHTIEQKQLLELAKALGISLNKDKQSETFYIDRIRNSDELFKIINGFLYKNKLDCCDITFGKNTFILTLSSDKCSVTFDELKQKILEKIGEINVK
jgi:hypothetical protein